MTTFDPLIQKTSTIKTSFHQRPLLLCILLLTGITFGFTQQTESNDTISRFSYGMNAGFYFPDNHPANFYNGSPANENKIDLILRNKYYVNQIDTNLLSNNITRFRIDTAHPYDLPRRMKYSPAYSLGFYLRYTLDKSLGIFAQFNFVKLTAKDVFLLKLDVIPPGYTLEPDYIACPIWGTEKRVNIDLGISKYFSMSPGSVFFIESGLNINNTRVVENKIAINEVPFSLQNPYGSQSYIPNSNLQQYQVIQGGIGFGIFATTGVRLVFSDNLSMDPGATFYWKGINLGTYDGFRPNYYLFIRFTFKNLI